MKFSTRTTYGLRAMIELAKNKEQGSVSLATIAKDNNISLKYLERLFSQLRKSKLVVAEKGASGGYSLARPSEKITVYDVVKALEGSLSPFHCIGEDGKVYCAAKCGCGVVGVLSRVQAAVNSTLKNIKLSDLS